MASLQEISSSPSHGTIIDSEPRMLITPEPEQPVDSPGYDTEWEYERGRGDPPSNGWGRSVDRSRRSERSAKSRPPTTARKTTGTGPGSRRNPEAAWDTWQGTDDPWGGYAEPDPAGNGYQYTRSRPATAAGRNPAERGQQQQVHQQFESSLKRRQRAADSASKTRKYKWVNVQRTAQPALSRNDFDRNIQQLSDVHAPVWRYYRDQTDAWDVRLVEKWDRSIDVFLLFPWSQRFCLGLWGHCNLIFSRLRSMS
ncbi:hypothetical protein CALCODRAFT_511923 [Calocera cornea HHB12733]|uniref:Uncharacterized protein n=1 Tax=Calocera cornea HHB12733 TaxID=1353952 RepID=A0A165DF27_9BASI|nr:hypothetical protein CALCODRAFT_511923 [Calocera cornea HHB12733]